MRQPTRVRWFLGFWLFILSGVGFLDRTNISIAGLSMIKEFGWSNQRLGFIFSAFLIGYAGFQLPAGFLVTRYGPRLVLMLGVLWWGVATLLTTMIPAHVPYALGMLIAVRFALGAGESVIYPAANLFVSRWIPQQERGFINGLIFAGVGAGSGLTPPLLTWIIVEHGWRSAFWFSAIVGFFAGAVWWIFSRDFPEDHPGVSRAELKEIREGLSAPNIKRPIASDQRKIRISWRVLLFNRNLATLALGYFSFGYVAWVFFSWFFLYLAQARGIDLRASARYAMLPFICMTVGSLAGGILSDRLTRLKGLRVGRCYLASFSLFLAAIFLILGSQVRSSSLAGVILAGGAGVLYLSQSSFWSASVDIAGRSSAVFSSIVNIGGQIGGALTASLTPLIAQRVGWVWSFAVAAGFALLGSICWLFVHPERVIEAAHLD
jgi:ACS family glucarate transporter-like MFS transporter